MSFDSPCVLIRGLPDKAFCGIDLLSFTTSRKFQGIKNLTEGWHHVFVSETNSFSLRYGAWFYVDEAEADSPPQLFILNWSAQNEELIPETDEAEILRYRANIGSLWRDGLTPYRQTSVSASEEEGLVEESHAWPSLTDSISTRMLSRITSVREHSTYWLLTSASSAPQDEDSIPNLPGTDTRADADPSLNLLPIDLKRTWRPGAIGRERTAAAQDRTWALTALLDDCDAQPADALGELQFTFACALTLNNNSCLEQWKRLLNLLLTCESGPADQPAFFASALRTLRMQLAHADDADGALFDLAGMTGGMVQGLLRRFRAGLETRGVTGGPVLDELDALDESMRGAAGWGVTSGDARVLRGAVELEDGERVDLEVQGADLEDESGEYGPTLVDLTPEQARIVLGEGGAGVQAAGRREEGRRDRPLERMGDGMDTTRAVREDGSDESDDSDGGEHLLDAKTVRGMAHEVQDIESDGEMDMRA